MKRLENAKARDEILQAASHFHGAHLPAPSPKPALPNTTVPAPVAALDMIKDTGAIVVVQHEGILDRLATDPHTSPLTRASTQTLSENLAKVSKAVAQLGSVDEHPMQANADPGKPQTNKPEPQPLRPLKIKSCSMSELLEDLHAIAAGMNIEISDPAEKETFVLAPSNVEADHPPVTAFDAEGLLSEPTTPGAVPTTPSHPAEGQKEPQHTREPTPGHVTPHFEDATSLLSEPTSPGPMSDETLGEAIAQHVRSQASTEELRAPPSAYVTALSTRNNSIQAPIPLPSSILRAADYSPIAESPASQHPASRQISSPFSRAATRFAPGHYPASPTVSSPWSVQSPKPTKRVRISHRWPPPEYETSPSPEPPTSEPDQAYIATELHKAVQEVAARERDLHRAVREAAEMERGLRRRVMMQGGSGGFKGQK